MMRRIVFAFGLALLSTACHAEVTGGSGGGGGAGGATPIACDANADCGSGEICVYAIREACEAHGSCQPIPEPATCGAIGHAQACGCDGSEVDWETGCSPSVPNGFAPAPIAHVGACDSTAQCDKSSDCTPENGYTPPEGFSQGVCAFPQDEGCAARGICLDPFPMCDSLDQTDGCGCDGGLIQMGCGYPSKVYSPRPLAHLGHCDGT